MPVSVLLVKGTELAARCVILWITYHRIMEWFVLEWSFLLVIQPKAPP